MNLTDKTHLYAIGCSHKAGSEICGAGLTAPTKQNITHAWPGQLAKHYELNYINHSKPGGSNEYIMRSTIDYVSQWLYQGRDPKELFVCAGWTTNERLEFKWEDKNIHWANGSDPEWFKKDYGDFTTWFKALQLYHTDYNFGLFKKITYMSMLDSFLKSHEVDHIQVNNCASIKQEYIESLRLKHLMHTFPNDVFFESDDSFIERYDTEDNASHFTEWYHADKHLHTLYADEVKKFIEEL